MQQLKQIFKNKKKYIKRGIPVVNKKNKGPFNYLQYRYSYFNSYYGLKLRNKTKGQPFNKKFKVKKYTRKPFKKYNAKKPKKSIKRAFSFKFKRNIELNRKYLDNFLNVVLKKKKRLYTKIYSKYKLQNIFKYKINKTKKVYISKRKVTRKLLRRLKKLKKSLKFKVLRKKIKFNKLTKKRFKLFLRYLRKGDKIAFKLLQNRNIHKVIFEKSRSNIHIFQKLRLKVLSKIKFKRKTRRRKLKVRKKCRVKRKHVKYRSKKILRKIYFFRSDFDIVSKKIKYKKINALFRLTNYYSKTLWASQKSAKKLKNNLANFGYYFYYKRNKFDKLLLDKSNYKQGIDIVKKSNSKEFLNLLKLLLLLFFRVYHKNEKIRLNFRKEVHNLKKYNKQVKRGKLNLVSFICNTLNPYNKPEGLCLNKKYLLTQYKKYFLQLFVKINQVLLKKTLTKNFFRFGSVIKALIKYLFIPNFISKDIYTRRKFKRANKVFYVFAQIILYNVKQIIKSNKYTINFFGLIEENINAEMLLKRIMKTMDITKSLKWLILNMIRKLEKSVSFFGFKVKFAGRLSSSIMARVDVVQKGLIPTNNMNVYIDYAKDDIVFKYGKCGIKVWLVRNLFVYMPYKYVYSYKFEPKKN